MNHLEHNRTAWNHGPMSRSVWAQPVDGETIRRARAGEWGILLTPRTPVPRSWFGELAGKDVLCLASGGGQQAPILAAAGARVVSFDLSDEQLQKDQAVGAREGLEICCVRGDMADLGVFAGGAFDLIFHPASNVFVPELAPVWAGCHRVLRPGGVLLAGFMNPAAFLFDHDEADASGRLVVKYSLPYSDPASLPPAVLAARMAAQQPLEFSHSLEEQIGGQLAAGFVLTGLYEDHSQDPTWLYSRHAPVSIATRAMKPA